MKKNIVKNLNKVYFKSVSTYSLNEILKKLEEIIPLIDDQPREDIVKEFVKEYDEVKSQKGDSVVMTFDVCHCEDFGGSYFILDILKIDDISNCDEKSEITLKLFKHVERSDAFKELMVIKNMEDYKDIDLKISAIKKFRKKLDTDIKEYDELDKISKTMLKACDVNKYILNYNKEAFKIFSQHKHGDNIKDLLLKFTGYDYKHLGYIEFSEEYDNGYDIHEMLIHIDLDMCTPYQNDKIIYEGCSISADMGTGDLNIIKYNEINQLARKIEDAISNSSTIESGYEITTDFEQENDCQYFISVEEFKTTLDRQLFNLKKNADSIFTNFYKLLYLIDVDRTYKEIK